jgi:hypothetical protein
MMTGKDKVQRKRFWTLVSEVTGRGRIPRERLGHLEVIKTRPKKDCRKTSFAKRTETPGTGSPTTSRWPRPTRPSGRPTGHGRTCLTKRST